MKSNTKDRLVISFIVGVFLVTVYGIGYILLSRPKATGVYTAPTMIVASSDSVQIDICKKDSTAYAIKEQGVLKCYGLNASILVESRLAIEAEEYDKLVEGKIYWFDIRLTKPDDMSSGVIKKVYTEDIRRR
jgi:hypothetical protein